jgi:hypothetical protein
MPPVRPTLRCLRVDLQLEVPPLTYPLEELDHPLVAKANEQFASATARHERIAAIDDQVFLKVKVQRWRGAVWQEPDLGWLVAGGWRESGSSDDFYASLAARAETAKSIYNRSNPALRTRTHSTSFLPGKDDRERYQAEADGRFDRRLVYTVESLVRRSLLDGQEHAANLGELSLGIQVRAADDNLTYVAVRIMGSVPPDVVATILDVVPGCDRDDWGMEQAMPDRRLRHDEFAYSNIMDPYAAAKLLDQN